MHNITIKTWSCDLCKYKQDFDPLTSLMQEIFPENIKNQCPSCKIGLVTNETDKTKRIHKHIIDEIDIDNDKDLTNSEKLENKKQRTKSLTENLKKEDNS